MVPVMVPRFVWANDAETSRSTLKDKYRVFKAYLEELKLYPRSQD